MPVGLGSIRYFYPGAPAPLVFMPKWEEVLKDGEIDAVAQYLLSLGKGAKKEDW